LRVEGVPGVNARLGAREGAPRRPHLNPNKMTFTCCQLLRSHVARTDQIDTQDHLGLRVIKKKEKLYLYEGAEGADGAQNQTQNQT